MNEIPARVPTVAPAPVEMQQLLWELVDAHADTVQLATRSASLLAWSAHIAYLRDLQRVAQERLARMDP